MTNEKLVLKDRELFGAKSIQIVELVNEAFQLGINDDLGALSQNIQDVLSVLRNPGIGNADSLLRIALERQETGSPAKRGSFSPLAEVWHQIGYRELATIFEEWYALADEVKIKIEYPGTEDAHPTVANSAMINGECRKLENRLGPLLENLPFTPQDIPQIVCEMFAIDLRPDHKFRDYWIDRILNSSGFANYAPPLNEHGLPEYEPFGWLTKRHVRALKAHGFGYKFAFWEEPVGDTRGHLWIQTDQGPLVLSDKTDATSLKTNFPVQVSSLARRKMFKLKEQDLAENARSGNILSRLFGQR